MDRKGNDDSTESEADDDIDQPNEIEGGRHGFEDSNATNAEENNNDSSGRKRRKRDEESKAGAEGGACRGTCPPGKAPAMSCIRVASAVGEYDKLWRNEGAPRAWCSSCGLPIFVYNFSSSSNSVVLHFILIRIKL
ncbi:unnamed protein product [Cuscuta campestris]|uniref:Uncharacterized protein n=1 Tax=Cuscuta campestris TaxID=132261 RepID=A0A484JYH5_9ASTE|nr:unnamed protein product [Cuscuta campestris]